MSPNSERTTIVFCPNLLSNVLKVLDLVVISIQPPGRRKPFKDVYSYHKIQDDEGISVKTIGKRCVDFTNKCLVSHRYEEAVKLLWILSQDVTVFDRFIFKAAMLTICNLKLNNKEEVIWNLLRKTEKIYFQSKKELQLEYLIYGIHNNVTDLKKRTKELISFKGSKKYDIIDTLLEAYYSFLVYIEWCSYKYGDIQASQAKLSAESAILDFKKIVTIPGNWDIFVLHLIKMLDSCYRSEEIEDVLLQYIECNPNNLNAYIYICSYLQNYSPNSEKLVHHLEVLAELCPSDERVLLLIEIYFKSEKLTECLHLIFMFLDYPSNGKNVQAWQMLSKLLHEVKLRDCDNELTETKSYWKARYKCWHWLYFDPSQVSHLNECDYQLIVIRIDVLSYFDTGHAYIKKVLKTFPGIQV